MQFHQNFESQLFDIRLLLPLFNFGKRWGKKKGKYIYIYITEAIFLAAFLFGGNLSCYLSVLISAVSVVRRRFTIRHPFRRRCKEEIDERGAHATCALRKKLLYKEGKFDFREVVWFFFFSSLSRLPPSNARSRPWKKWLRLSICSILFFFRK